MLTKELYGVTPEQCAYYALKFHSIAFAWPSTSPPRPDSAFLTRDLEVAFLRMLEVDLAFTSVGGLRTPELEDFVRRATEWLHVRTVTRPGLQVTTLYKLGDFLQYAETCRKEEYDTVSLEETGNLTLDLGDRFFERAAIAAGPCAVSSDELETHIYDFARNPGGTIRLWSDDWKNADCTLFDTLELAPAEPTR